MNQRQRRAAIRRVFETWTDGEAKRALEYVENGRPIFCGSDGVRMDVIGEDLESGECGL